MPPRLLLLDGDAVNAAAIGRSRDDAIVIVSRRLLDEYDREETQGIIGHLIGSIGNGDLDIAFWMTSVLLSFSLSVAILKTPFSVNGRTTFLRLIRLGIRGWRGGLDGAADKELLTRMINGNFAIEDMDDKRMPPLLVPFMLASIAVQWTLFVLVPGLLQPFLALLWRKRRYLADATAVQLTRNPEGLARALFKPSWAPVPGGQGVAHLFLYGPVGSESIGDFFMWKGVGFHPTTMRRLQRLRALGAHVDLSKLDAVAPRQPYPLLFFAIEILLGLLMLVVAVTCVLAIGLFVLLSMFFMGLFLMAIHGVFVALGAVKGWIFG
jgi:Zn-dependent protease with chaperone function